MQCIIDYRYISGPKKATANKGKFYSGIPIKRLEELKSGTSVKYLPVSNFYDFSGAFGNCRLEGGVGFKGGKKPEALLKMILDYFTNEGDLVLDSFAGSASTAAVAHKMNRKWITIELGEHAYSLCKNRLDYIRQVAPKKSESDSGQMSIFDYFANDDGKETNDGTASDHKMTQTGMGIDAVDTSFAVHQGDTSLQIDLQKSCT